MKYCDACKRSYSSKNWSHHIDKMKHRYNVQLLTNPNYVLPSKSRYYCTHDSCKKSYVSKSRLETHLKDHTLCISKNKVYRYFCIACEVPVRNNGNKRTHIQSKNHKENVRERYGTPVSKTIYNENGPPTKAIYKCLDRSYREINKEVIIIYRKSVNAPVKPRKSVIDKKNVDTAIEISKYQSNIEISKDESKKVEITCLLNFEKLWSEALNLIEKAKQYPKFKDFTERYWKKKFHLLKIKQDADLLDECLFRFRDRMRDNFQ